MFKFLKLQNSDSGDARRHVPFASIIHKHIIPFVLVFVFVLFSSVNRVYAIDYPLPPVWLPMNPYNAEGLEGNYVILNDDQKKIAKELIGAYGSVFMGLAANPLQNPLQTVDNVRSWWQEFGDAFLDSIFNNSVWTSSYQNPKAIVDMVGSVTQKASTYNSYNDYVNDTSPNVSSGLEKYMNYTPELTVAFKNWYAVNGNLYDWQQQVKPFKSNVSWFTVSVSNVLQNEYDYLVSYINKPNVRANKYLTQPSPDTYSQEYNIRYFNNTFANYTNLFVNTDTHYIDLYDDSGNKFNGTSEQLDIVSYYKYSPSDNYEANYSQVFSGMYALNLSYNSSNYSNYADIVRDVYNFVLIPSSNYKLFYEDFVKHVYVGADWSSKQEIFNIDDLNIAASPSAYIDNVGSEAYVDINGLIDYLGDDVTDVRTGIIDNTLVRDGDRAVDLTDSLLVAIDRVIEETKSGIIVPTDVFSSLFDDGKGFISYMWYMTKPLVLYTRDLLDLLTFDPVEGFNASGPGYFVLGVVGLGVIGGVIVKFLL